MELIVWYMLAGVGGASIGSFITMLVYRLREKKSIVFGRSSCTHCKKNLAWFELIPIISFVCVRGVCRSCEKKIPLRYLLIELATTVLFVLTLYTHLTYSSLPELYIIRDWIIVSAAVFIFTYDALYLEVHPGVTIGAGVVVGVLYLIGVPSEWKTLVYGIIVGVGWFTFQYVVSKGAWIGGGDSMIGFFMGASLGLSKTILALGIAYIVGASYALSLLLLKKKNRKDQIAFGTFLMIGTIIALLWGQPLVEWYRYIVFS